MASKQEEKDIRHEMRVALYWRALIGDGEYVKFDPDDMLRWYEALELRGPDEIRALRNERYRTTQTGGMLGIVSKAPHPPVWLVNQWIEQDEHQVHTLGYWGMSFAFVVVSFLIFGNLQGCVALQPMNPLWMHPPPNGVSVEAYTQPSIGQVGNMKQGIAATGPSTAAAPFTPAITGPTSNGIAGAASGAVPSTGVTGGQNIGASAGLVQGSGTAQP
jgi:hypothetical protein